MRSQLAFTRIVTHDDLDGVVSAALLSFCLGVDRFFFTGPVSVQEGRTPTTEEDVVCDLPCPVRVGMWFDHHQGNLEDLKLRGIDPADVPGRFSAEPSCARVIFDYFQAQAAFPPFTEETVAGTDRVDSFDYRTMEEWRRPTPDRRLADSIYVASLDRGSYRYLERLVRLLRERPMEEVLKDPQVAALADRYEVLEEKSLSLFRQDASFHPDDPEHEVVVIDLTRHNRRPEVIRGAAFVLHPEALAALMVGSGYAGGRKTNDLSFSMSLSFLMNRREHHKDIGEIMRRLNIGDGHPGAGAGRISCRTRDEMLKVKGETLGQIVRIWKEMG